MLYVFSLCVAEEPLVAPTNSSRLLPRNNADTPTSKQDHLFCHRPAEPVMAGFEIQRQRNIYTEDGSSTFLRKVWTYSPNYKSSHPGKNIHASTLAERKRISYDQLTTLQGDVPTVYTFSRQSNFMVTSSSTCLPQSGVWNQCKKVFASTHDTKTLSFALSEIRNKKLHCNCIIIIIIIIIQQIIAL